MCLKVVDTRRGGTFNLSNSWNESPALYHLYSISDIGIAAAIPISEMEYKWYKAGDSFQELLRLNVPPRRVSTTLRHMRREFIEFYFLCWAAC